MPPKPSLVSGQWYLPWRTPAHSRVSSFPFPGSSSPPPGLRTIPLTTVTAHRRRRHHDSASFPSRSFPLPRPLPRLLPSLSLTTPRPRSRTATTRTVSDRLALRLADDKLATARTKKTPDSWLLRTIPAASTLRPTLLSSSSYSPGKQQAEKKKKPESLSSPFSHSASNIRPAPSSLFFSLFLPSRSALFPHPSSASCVFTASFLSLAHHPSSDSESIP